MFKHKDRMNARKSTHPEIRIEMEGGKAASSLNTYTLLVVVVLLTEESEPFLM